MAVKEFTGELDKPKVMEFTGELDKPKVQEFTGELDGEKRGPRVAKEDEGDFMRGIANIPGQLENIYGAGKVLTGLVANKLGATDTGKDLIKSGMERMSSGEAKQVVKESDDFLKAWEKGIGTVVTDWLPYQIGSGAGNIAETLAFMGLGGAAANAPGAVAGVVSKSLVKAGIKEAAEKVLEKEGKEAAAKFVADQAKRTLMGQTAGMVAQAGFHGAGETTGRAVEEAQRRGERVEDIELGRLLPAAAVHATADFFVNKIGVDALKIGEAPLKNLALEVGKRIAITGTKELPAEEIQTMAERYGAKLSLTDAEALKEYVNTAAASYAMSVAPGGVGGVRSYLAGKDLERLKRDKEFQEKNKTETETVEDVQHDADTEEKLKKILGLVTEEKGEANVAGTVNEPVGGGAELSTPPAANEPAGGIAGAEPDGVVSTATDAGPTDVGETTKPPTVVQAGTMAAADVRTKADELIKKQQEQGFAPDDAKREALATSRNELLDMIDDGLPANNSKVKSKLKALNNLEQSLGLKLSTYDEVSFDTTPVSGSVLSAKKQPPQYIDIETLKGQLKAEGKEVPDNLRVIAAADTHPAYKIDPNATEEENLRGAMELVKKREEIEAEETNTGLEESKVYTEGRNKGKPKPEVRYDKDKIPENAEELYNDAREDKPDLPEWYKLKIDEKDVFFENVRRNTLDEYYKAADALIAHRKEKGSRAEGYKKIAEGELTEAQKEKLAVADRTSTPAGQRTILNYEANRDIASKLLQIKLPRWGDLSPAAQKAYLNAIVNNAARQMDVAFAAAAEQMVQEQQGLSQQQRQATVDNIRRLQDKVRLEAEKNQAELQRIQREYERAAGTEAFVPGKAATKLSKTVIDHLMKGRLNLALEEIAKTLSKNPDPQNKMAGRVAARLAELGLKTKVRVSADPLTNNDLAQYDPVADEIVIGPEGFSTSTVLHEVTHAGTVRVLYLYLSGKKNLLTERQIKGAEQILKIMMATKNALAKEFPNAYELDENGENPNVYEFIAYAMNDKAFQAALDKFSVGYTEGILMDKALKDAGFKPMFGTQPIESMLPEKKSAWSAFKKAIAGIINFAKTPFNNVNFVMELNAAFDDILSVPTGGINVNQTFSAKQAEGLPEINIDSKGDGFDTATEDKPASLGQVSKLFTTVPGLKTIATRFQNSRYFVKAWEATHELSEQIWHFGQEKLNNVYTQLTLAAARARNLYTVYVSDRAERLNAAVGDYAKAAGLSTDEALSQLHKILEAVHEPERRLVKFLMTVPLRDKPNQGEAMSPADLRVEIMKLLDTKKLSKQAAQALRTKLEDVIFTKDANGNRVVNRANVDPLGSSPRISSEDLAKIEKRQKDKTAKLDLLDIDSGAYNVSVMDSKTSKRIRDQYEAHKNKTEIDEVIKSIQALHESTTTLNKMANYWSNPVDNRVNFYGFKNYIPMKGYTSSKTDEMLSFDTMRRGKELQELDHAFDGRSTVGKNPILQTMSDATRSALRAGRKDLTLSIRNAIQQGLIEGKVHDPISFEDRQNPDVLKKLPRENTVFHYNEDGSIQVLEIKNQNMRESIRRTYETSKPVVELANMVTSGIGALHTRYNYSFAPMNFVRDALTNAFAIGADMGPAEAAKFITAMTGQVVGGNGLYKAMRVASMYTTREGMAQLEKEDDPYIKQMMEFVKEGGMVSYLEGLALKSNFQKLHKEIGKSGIVQSKEQLDKFVDIWTDMFELASRTAAYGIAKQNELNKLEARVQAGTMTKQEAEETAKIKGVAYAKNLANFEQVGTMGRAMGAFYMFFRPAATGAVRAIESLAPAFPGSLERAIANLPPTVRDDATALENFKRNYAEKQSHARVMTASLIGLGSIAYLMAMMMSDDDELGRNAVLNDNMQQWTRYARFHIPRDITRSMGINEPVVFQIPWGFGLGAFAAAGAQMTGAVVGKTSVKDALANIFLQISLDSFVPLPVSKMPPTEMPLEFFLDSVAPSVTRPLLEFALNKNGLGQNIYNDQNRRFGDAYTGGDRIPEIYKDMARGMANQTLGGIDVSPNTLYFLANSYLDGVSRLFEAGYGLTDLAQGRKGFNPKTDIPLMGSFFGAKSNVDSREFSEVEKSIQAMERKVKMFDSNPEMRAKYMAEHPMDHLLVDMYNRDINGQLKDLRSRAKQIRLMEGLTPADRDAMLKIVTFQQNLVKHNLVEKYKAYGVKP